jgi:uncharacterized membrane protein
MSFTRMGRHLFAGRWALRRHFDAAALRRIEHAIIASEAVHTGQIRFTVEAALEGRPLLSDQSARARAIDLFGQLRVWDTAQNNGVLIYLLFADRSVEIVADRGIDRLVGAAGWQAICDGMEADFRTGDFVDGVLRGIARVGAVMQRHFPAKGPHRNELPDAPIVVPE